MASRQNDGRGGETWRYRAFVSYSHADKRWGRWLARTLETWRVPRRLVGRETAVGRVPARLAPVFRDRDELPAGAELGEHIHRALEDSAALLVICSPAAARSRWVNDEILAYKRLGREKRILALVVAGDPKAGDGPRQCFPPALRFRLGPDGALSDEPAEPAAADARAEADGKSRARLKLLAGLLGVGYDELAQREHQRHVRRLAVISGASLAGMVLTGYLAVTAMIAREDADRSREKAEDLIGFMLGDLSDNLRAVGRLDLFDAIGDEALDYFESLTDQDMTSRTLAQRADALTLIGETAVDRADLAEAVRAFTQSVEQARALAAREPRSGSWQRQLAESELWLGYAQWQQGDLTEALRRFRLALEAAERSRELDPADANALATQSTAHSNIAQVLERRGQLDEARGEYETVLGIQEALARSAPGNADWQAELGFAHNTLGKVELRLGRLDAARLHYAQDLEIKRALVAADPEHSLWQRYLAISEAHMGTLDEYGGDRDGAVMHIDKAISLSQRLVELEPGHATRKRWLARLLVRRGRLARMDGALPVALTMQRDALAMLEVLVAKDPGNIDTRLSLAEARVAVAETLISAGDTTPAAAQGRDGLAALRALVETDPSNVDIQVELARGELTTARALRAEGDAEGAFALFAAARDRLDAVVADSADPVVLHARVAALAGLGEQSAARPIIERLLAAGYRQPDFMALVPAVGGPTAGR